MVIIDPLPTTASEFWHAPGVDPASIQTEALFLPATHWIEKSGSFVNSGRWVQWKHKALPATGESRDDNWILGHLYQRLRALYEQEGGALPDPVLGLDWYYADPGDPSMEELAQEVNGKDLTTGRAARVVRSPSQGRRDDVVGRLDLLRLVDRRGQPDGPPGHRRSDRPRLLPRLGVVVAAQPAGDVQPRLGRRQRPAVGPDPAGDRAGTARPGSATSPTFPPTRRPTTARGRSS